MNVFASSWATKPWCQTQIDTGPLAWEAEFLLSQTPDALKDKPSLVCVRYSPDLDYYTKLASAIPSHWPIALSIAEPQFTRTFTPMVLDRLARLNRPSADLLILNVQDPADLKAGGLPRQMQLLRELKKIGQIGLHHTDVLQIEWLASHTTARVLAFPYRMAHQLARYRAIEKAAEYGMACLGVDSLLASDPLIPASTLDLSLRLSQSQHVLPMIAQPLDDITPMDEAQSAAVWEAYKQSTPEPPKLPRSLPPE
jgi:hypothetical protein